MVFQKKGPTAAKNTQANKKKGKKAFKAEDDLDMFEDMDDSDDFEDDSDTDMPVQKTPKNKTPKGRQSLSEKKVSFEVPDKTPGKTPKKNISFIGKTPTPVGKGKTSLQEVKGIKEKVSQKRAAEDDDSDDDYDSEEDEDFKIEDGMVEEDEDEESDDDGEEDEDDEEEEEDDDDEDDDDDDDEEDEEQIKPNLKQKNVIQLKQKTPVKGTKSLKGNQIPKDEVKKEQNGSKKEIMEEKATANTSESQAAEVQRRRERDSKTLYIGNLPKDVTSEELKGLSKDIKEVIIPRSKDHNKRAFAFLTFESEAKTEATHKILQSKKLRNQTMNIDFVGEKSLKQPVVVGEKQFDMLKLFVTGVPPDATLDQVCKYFPKASDVRFNRSLMFRSATIGFLTEKDATEAFMANKEIEVNGHTLVVVHCTANSKNKKNRRYKNKKHNKNNQNNQENPPKKMKFTKQEEEESSDEE